MGMNLLDFLKTAKAEASAEAPREAAKCRRVPLPEVFELPRRFGVSWGCLTSGAFYGSDAVVVEVNVRGVYIRYVLPYDSKARRYVEVYRPRVRGEGGGLGQTLADALYELADRRRVEVYVEYKCTGGAVCDKRPYALVDGVRFDSYFCGGWTVERCIEEIEKHIREKEREKERGKGGAVTVLDYLKAMSASAEAPREAARCRQIPLPEVFALPRRFGVSWGCLREKAFNGVDAVVVEVSVKGVHLRYVLPYDGKARRYIAEYRKREEREEKCDRLPQYFADALYELAAKYEIEITNDSYVLIGGAEVDKTICYQRRRSEDCARAIERYVRDWPRMLEERRRLEEERRREELRRQVLQALGDWYRSCFKQSLWPGREREVISRLELYHAMCQMAKAAIAEYGRWHEIPTDEYSLRRAFWWDGQWRGRPISCFVTDRKAYCVTDGKKAVFYVIDAPDGLYLRPETRLFDEWIKAAHRGDGDYGV